MRIHAVAAPLHAWVSGGLRPVIPTTATVADTV